MSTDAWLVNNPQVQEFNALMAQAVANCRRILDDVETVLARMPQAAQTSALSPWADLKAQWNARYNNLLINLGGTAKAGEASHDAYKWGNSQSVRAML